LSLPDYFEKVKHPMDIGTVAHKLDNQQYTELEEVLADVALVWNNCLMYNPPTHDVSIWANELKVLFTPKLQTLLAKEKDKRARNAAYELKRKTAGTAAATPRRPKTPRMTETLHTSAAAAQAETHDPALMDVIAQMHAKMQSMESEITTLRSSQEVTRRGGRGGRATRGTRGSGGSARRGSARGRSARGARGGRSARGTPRAGPVTPAATPVVRAPPAVHIAPMTHEEKVALSQHIHELPGRKLGPVVQIIQEAMQLAGEDQPDEIEIDIDSLDPATLRKLESYIHEVRRSKPKSMCWCVLCCCCWSCVCVCIMCPCVSLAMHVFFFFFFFFFCFLIVVSCFPHSMCSLSLSLSLGRQSGTTGEPAGQCERGLFGSQKFIQHQWFLVSFLLVLSDRRWNWTLQ
jgi:bromodomain-containing factor 1